MPKDGVEMEWEFSELESIFENLGKDVIDITKVTTKKMADKIKDAVIEELPRSEPLKTKEKKYQHDSSKEYIHMKDDVVVSRFIYDNGEGESLRTIHGGYYTGYKWKWLEFGTVKMDPIPFMTRALLKTEKECADIVDKEIGKIVKALGGAPNND